MSVCTCVYAHARVCFLKPCEYVTYTEIFNSSKDELNGTCKESYKKRKEQNNVCVGTCTENGLILLNN